MNFLHATFLSFLFIIVSLKIISAALSGIFVDNGAGQTWIKSAFTPKQKNILKRNFRDMLGLYGRPKINPSDWSYIKDSASHNYLLNIHNAITDDTEIENKFDMEDEETQLALQSDSVLALIPQTDYVDDAEQGRMQRLSFDATDVPSDHLVVKAGLRLYKDYRDDLKLQGMNFTINVHHVVLNSKGDKQLELVDSISVDEEYVGWLMFNVTAPLLLWATAPSINDGLHITIQKHPDSSHEHPHNMGIISNLSVSDEKLRHPFVVAFLKVDDKKLKAKPRFKRYVHTEMEVSSALLVGDELDGWVPPGDTCKVHTLYMAFEGEFAKWESDYIIAPLGVIVNYCQGECWWPIAKKYNATNHAIMQALTNLLQPNLAPQPGCIPSILTRLSYLYLISSRTPMMKVVHDITAKRCACR